jgi:hypothetical protein
MTSSLDFDPSILPNSPLTMSLLVGLESSALRKLLKNGLRRGMSEDQIRAFFLDTWHLELESSVAVHLLELLETRGWLTQSAETGLWKTHLGSSKSF